MDSHRACEGGPFMPLSEKAPVYGGGTPYDWPKIQHSEPVKVHEVPTNRRKLKKAAIPRLPRNLGGKLVIDGQEMTVMPVQTEHGTVQTVALPMQTGFAITVATCGEGFALPVVTVNEQVKKLNAEGESEPSTADPSSWSEVGSSTSSRAGRMAEDADEAFEPVPLQKLSPVQKKLLASLHKRQVQRLQQKELEEEEFCGACEHVLKWLAKVARHRPVAAHGDGSHEAAFPQLELSEFVRLMHQERTLKNVMQQIRKFLTIIASDHAQAVAKGRETMPVVESCSGPPPAPPPAHPAPLAHVFPARPTPPAPVTEAETQEARETRTREAPAVSWDDKAVSVIVDNIPRCVSQLQFLEEVQKRGFTRKFDFLYLPYDPAEGANEGFGLVSFLRPSVARDFYREFNGTFLRVAPVQGKALYVHASPIQGFAELYEKFKPDPNSHQDPKCSPLFLRRPPATLEHAAPQRPKVSRGVARRLCPRCSSGLQDSVCPNCGAKVQAEFEVARTIANPHREGW